MTHPQRRAIFKAFYKTHLSYDRFQCANHSCSKYNHDELRDLGLTLLQEDGFDEKFEGIECLVKIAKKMTVDDFKLLEPVIDGFVFDWATCDNLSCHVVSPAMLANPALLAVC